MKIIIFVIFGLITLVRAIQSAADEKEKQQKPAQDGREDQRQKVQSEIDAFLTEVGAAPPAKPQRKSKPPATRQQKPEKPAPVRARRQTQSQRRASPQRRPQTPPPAAVPGDSAQDRVLGSGVGEHVDTYIRQHVEEYVESHVDDYLDDDIVESVETHLGSRASQMPKSDSDPPPDAGARFRQLLRSQNGMRQAILLNEILQRPGSIRRR